MASRLRLTEADVWAALAEIPDPEIPVVSLVDRHGRDRATTLTLECIEDEVASYLAGLQALRRV